MELFKKLRREKEEIEKEQQEMANAYLKSSPPSLKPLAQSPWLKERKARKAVKLRKTRPRKGGQVKKSKPVRKSAKGGAQEGNFFNDALVDLEKELRSLRIARRQLEGELKKLTSELGFTQSKEFALRNKISELIKKEKQLEEKRSSLKDKFNDVLSRIEKVRTIEAQLKGV